MSRWDSWSRYRSEPKQLPPKHGIKVKGAGSTWWARCWVEALEKMAPGYGNRLTRGMTYARAGRVHDLVVKGNEVHARVAGTRGYSVVLALRMLSDRHWKAALRGMAAKAQFAAELLAGAMPARIDDVFREAGASLFPLREDDLRTDCSCPDWANPCKHVAATHFVLGEALDRDPFLLFQLRGRTREQVLEGLAAVRTAGRPAGGEDRGADAGDVETVSIGRMKAADYERPRAPLPVPALAFDASAAEGAVLRQLGQPVGWNTEKTPVELFGPAIRAAARLARDLAMGSAGGEPDGEPATAPPAAAARPRKAAGRSPAAPAAARGAGPRREAKRQSSAKAAKPPARGKSAGKTRGPVAPSSKKSGKLRR